MPLTEEERMDRAGTEKVGAAMQPGVKNLQRRLASVGLQVKQTGVVDDATTQAINGIFAGWDDAPAKMRTGKLTASEISRNLPLVTKYVKKALGEAQNFGDSSKD